jgi:hypothetical protein
MFRSPLSVSSIPKNKHVKQGVEIERGLRARKWIGASTQSPLKYPLTKGNFFSLSMGEGIVNPHPILTHHVTY